MSSEWRVLLVFGTRPEAIKLCPLVRALQTSPVPLAVTVCTTGQHREMTRQVLESFSVVPDIDLDVMTEGQSLNELSARLLAGLEPVFQAQKPALTIVQGDTASAFCGALSSFHRKVLVAHVEAGLRTFDWHSPFPEEGYRVLIDRLSQLHFAATDHAAENLRREGFSPDSTFVTGNTGIDALLQTVAALESARLHSHLPQLATGRRLILVTAHRRENLGGPLDEICRAVQAIAGRPDVQILWPVHPNPQVKGRVWDAMAGLSNVLLCDPLDYVSLVDGMRRSTLILTDSGGIQEEAPALGKPVLVLREKTERPEGIAAGIVRLAGIQAPSIIAETGKLLDDSDYYESVAQPNFVYGDGQASGRIVRQIVSYLSRSPTN